MIDSYTRIILTVIAVALIALVGEQAFAPAAAQSTSCGSIEKPCYVAVGYVDAFDRYLPCHAESPCAKR